MSPSNRIRRAIETMQRSARLMGSVPGSGVFCDFRELDRKFEAFRLFQYAGREIDLPVERRPIHAAVSRALAQDAFRAIWILEGIGRIQALSAGLHVSGLLSEGAGALLPDRALIPLHTGLGVGFAEKLLGMLGPNPSTAELRRTIEHFAALCRANCRPGWEDASLEPIGLVVRCLYPHLVAPAAGAMDTVSANCRRLFWHGVGRALYFTPTNFMPISGAHSRMLRAAAAECRGTDRTQVLAGLVWAATLVNLPQPAVIRSLLPIASEMGIQSELTNGLISALLAWRHMAPCDERYLSSYTLPSPERDRDAALWASWVETPAREALATLYPGLEAHNRIPALYTCRAPEELRELSAANREVLT